jgi:hypothetical protein
MKTHRIPDPSDERLEKLLSELDRLEARSEFLVELSLDERCALPKLDEDREQFTRRALDLAREHPELLPAHVDPDRMLKGLAFRKRALELFERSNKVTERLDDSIVASGSEAYVTALNVLQSLASRAEVDPSLKEELEELQRLFQPWEDLLH